VSQENVETIERYFDAVNRGDFAEAMSAYADDVVLVVDERIVPTNAGVFSGRDAVGEWFGDWFRSFARGYQFDIHEMRPAGERVFVAVRHRGRGRSSGVAIDWNVGLAFAVNAGKIVRLELFSDRSGALKAVGLEE
jgi:ketosteroid isomerase-like protein